MTDKELILQAKDQVFKGNADEWKICNVKNDAGKLDTNDCIDCPLWFGMMLGGCCKALRNPAKVAAANYLRHPSKQTQRRMRHCMSTLSEFIQREVDVNEHQKGNS